MNPVRKLSSTFIINSTFSAAVRRRLSTKSGNDEWNDAWEAAWLPDDLSGKNRAPWEADVNFALSNDTSNTTKNIQIESRVPEVDTETKAFVEDMNENWHLRKGKQQKNGGEGITINENESSLYSLENIKRDYRLKKQRVHAGLWLKEIEKMEETKLGDSIGGSGNADDIEKLLDSCSEIFDSPNDDSSNSNTTSEFKNKPDGWETTSKTQDGNIWEMSQREEDILVQEFERRIAFNKFQIASFIKTHIFSRRRPIDGWKYMIEEIGPNARKGKGSVSRLPSIADASTRPFREEDTSSHTTFPSNRGRTERR
ncbi:protein GAMETE CELL DEFECTIVE 1, mitochondrial-like [Solanum stenotomum]|uniref:protein GAMETE CELL DEFECTIVE 1, mitochondrial-like n=1 Tax=Solanum stenotomum TaxID=172797 RepID=UPI0020D02652|nr:protein GAMETE CELL DEFECTIVE 1, mitochondrial-like [Solanum stenotomum]